MKFFTPELHLRYASENDDVALEAHDEWERQVKRYHRHYKKIESQLPNKFRQFHEEQCLHDADVFAPAMLPRNMPWNGQDVVIVAQQINTLYPEFINTLAILEYTITSPPTVEIPVESPVFKRGQVQPIWLHDEVDVVEPGIFAHQILVSDGRVIKLLFSDFTYHIAPLVLPGNVPTAAETKKPKQQMASA